MTFPIWQRWDLISYETNPEEKFRNWLWYNESSWNVAYTKFRVDTSRDRFDLRIINGLIKDLEVLDHVNIYQYA